MACVGIAHFCWKSFKNGSYVILGTQRSVTSLDSWSKMQACDIARQNKVFIKIS